MERIEGSGASQLVQLIRAIGYNTDVSIELATVTSAPPKLKIKVDHMNIELEKDDLIVAQSLTKHTRTINITSDSSAEMSSSSVSSTNEVKVMVGNVAGTGAATFGNLSMKSAKFTLKDAQLEFVDELKEGDRVLVAGIQQGQTYLILDRAVMY